MDAVDWHCAVDLVGRHWTVPERHPVRRYGSEGQLEIAVLSGMGLIPRMEDQVVL